MLSLGMPLSELSALLVFATAMAFTPGPNTTLAAALAANHGLAHAMRFVLAVPVGWGLLLLACSWGLGAVLQAQPLLKGAIQWGGLGYMLWLAWKLWSASTLTQADPARFSVGFGKGVALQFINIKAWMNALLISAGWVAVGAGVEGPYSDRARLALVLPLMMFYGLASNFTYALVGASLRTWLAQGRRLQVFNRVLALVLVATAAWMGGL